jgi:hypothetical protein
MNEANLVVVSIVGWWIKRVTHASLTDNNVGGGVAVVVFAPPARKYRRLNRSLWSQG